MSRTSVSNVEHRFEAPARCECGQRGLTSARTSPLRAGMGNGSSGQAIAEMPVDEQTPNIAEADFARKVLDVHTAIAQCARLDPVPISVRNATTLKSGRKPSSGSGPCASCAAVCLFVVDVMAVDPFVRIAGGRRRVRHWVAAPRRALEVTWK